MNSLTELKKIIQSMNETLTQDNINAFLQQVSQLEQGYKTLPVTSFFKMMQSLGKYLNAKKNNIHSDTMPILKSIAEKLDILINTPDLGKDQALQILSKEIQKYKSLKNKIASRPEVNDADINDLKAVILAIDWEISDTTLQNFETVITNLMSKLKNYKIHHTFLKIIHSTGQYIGTQKANASADSISFLRSVFDNFEHIVKTPDMSFKDKRKGLETDINRFHDFKHMIHQKKEKQGLVPGLEPEPESDWPEDESIQPALSHIKSKGIKTPEDLQSLTTLPDREDPGENRTGKAVIKPTIAKTPAAPRDVMDDLFNIKETPADELLDAIHLMDVQGSNPDQAMTMLDKTDTLQSPGIKNFTPQQKDNAPIPEIGNRLDEFFNLDNPGDTFAVENDVSDTIPEDIIFEDNAPEEHMIPFQDMDEPVDENVNINDDAPLIQSPDASILNRLKSTIEDSEWQRYDASMLSIKEDISFLEKCWENDPDKTCLLQIIGTITHQQNPLETIHQKNKTRPNGAGKTISDIRPKKPLGILGKIRGLFTS